MNDIKKSSHSLKYKNQVVRIPLIRSGIEHTKISHQKLLNRKVEDFESGFYADDSNNESDPYDIVSYYKSEKTREPFNKIRNRETKIKKPFFLSLKSQSFLLVFFVLLTLYFTFTFVFNSASVVLVQKSQGVTVNNTFTFSNNENSGSYQVLEIKKEISKVLQKGEYKDTNAKAYGFIKIYNNYNENPQKLVKNTRFESLTGKIFRITESVTIPPKNSNGPGSIVVKVTADSAGSDYNILPTKFTIPGFKGGARYDLFYGVSEDSMSGGSSGKSLVYSAEDVSNADMELRSDARELIKKDLPSIYKKGFSPIYDPSLISYTNNEKDIIENKSDKYTVYAVSKIILLKNDFIANELAKLNIPNYTNQIMTIKDMTNLRLELATTTLNNTKNEVEIKIIGQATLIMNINKENLKMQLAGKNNDQKEFNAVLSKFSEINQAVPKVFPFWVKTFPKNPNKIEITIKEN